MTTVLDGASIIDKHLVTIPDQVGRGEAYADAQVQPNGVDLRVKSISHVTGKAFVPTEGKADFGMVNWEELPTNDGWYELEKSAQYVVNFQEEISVSDGFCAIIVPRSSLLRAGAFITSALWDTGFQGQLGGVIRPLNDIAIQRGARLAQVLFLRAEFNGKRYEGRYQGSTSQTALMT